MPSSHPVTLRDIAARLGVSHATVSLALRDSPEVGAQTRERVKQAAQEMGYRPHPHISTLMQRRRSGRPPAARPGLVFYVEEAAFTGWRIAPLVQRYYEYAREAAALRGYGLEAFFGRAGGLTPARAATVLDSRGIEGILFGPLPEPAALEMPVARFACVALGNSILHPVLHRAVNHGPHAMLTALRALTRAGYRRIGLTLRAETDARTGHAYLGTLLAHQRLQARHRTTRPLIHAGQLAEFTAWLHREKPDCVVTLDPVVETWLATAGLRVPGDIGFARLSIEDAAITGLHQPYGQIAAAAVDLLISLVQKGERGIPPVPQHISIAGHWRDGTTTRPAPVGATDLPAPPFL
jgi:LacI family transcriptional regulator